MKFQPDVIHVQSIQGCGPGWIEVEGSRLTRSVIIGTRGERLDWQCDRFEDLSSLHFEQLADLRTELVIFGSGQRLRFVRPEMTRALIERQIGIDTMDTAAACRTYNVLASEGRCVAVGLLIEASRT